METVIVAAVTEILGVEGVGVHDDFFARGGSSLSAARLATHLDRILDRRVPVATVFENPTPAGLAAAISAAPSTVRPDLVRRPRPEVVGVSERQRGLWTLNRVDPTSSAYVIALTLDLVGPVDVDALTGAVRDVVRRHETLRTVYPLVGDRPVQVIVPAEQALAVVEIAARTVDPAHVDVAIADVTGRGFDLMTEPGVQAGILRVDADRHVLAVAIHHMNADGASLAPLTRDLATAYAARLRGVAPHLGHATDIDYTDWSRWHTDHLSTVGADGSTEEQRQLAHWSDRLSGAPDRSDLPTDRPRRDVPGLGATVDVTIPADVVAGEPAPGSIGAYARRYVAEIREVQPHGPYHLLGWSLGGHVAHAMAQQLEAAGEEVAILGLLDTWVGELDVRNADAGPADPLDGWRTLFDLGDDVRATTPDEVAVVVRDHIARSGLLPVDRVDAIVDSFAGADAVAAGHHLGRVRAPAVVVVATADKTDPATVAESWEPHCGSVTRVDVDAGHLRMGDADVLAVVAWHLRTP